jgi:hypothetical protein
MNRPDIDCIIGFVKGLFPVTTAEQVAVVADILERLDDRVHPVTHENVSATLVRAEVERQSESVKPDAGGVQRLSIPALREVVDAEKRRREYVREHANRSPDVLTQAQEREAVAALIDDLTDDDLAGVKALIVGDAADAAARKLWESCNPRTHGVMRKMIYLRLRAPKQQQRAPRPAPVMNYQGDL